VDSGSAQLAAQLTNAADHGLRMLRQCAVLDLGESLSILATSSQVQHGTDALVESVVFVAQHGEARTRAVSRLAGAEDPRTEVAGMVVAGPLTIDSGPVLDCVSKSG